MPATQYPQATIFSLGVHSHAVPCRVRACNVRTLRARSPTGWHLALAGGIPPCAESKPSQAACGLLTPSRPPLSARLGWNVAQQRVCRRRAATAMRSRTPLDSSAQQPKGSKPGARVPARCQCTRRRPVGMSVPKNGAGAKQAERAEVLKESTTTRGASFGLVATGYSC
jgi:hypothetical protein